MSEYPNNRLLQSLAAQDMDELAGGMRASNLEAGAVIYEPEAEIEAVWFPESGLIAIHSVMLSGETVQTSIIGNEGAAGVLEACGAGRTYSRAVVEVGGRFHRVPARVWCDCYDRSAVLRTVVQAYTQLLLIESRQLIACNARHLGSSRLAWLLLSIQDRVGGSGSLPLTQDALADMLGAQRTTISGFAAHLRELGAIEYHRGMIKVTDRARLEKAACECYATSSTIKQEIDSAASLKAS